MEKWLCWATMGLSGVLLLVFLLDLVLFKMGGSMVRVVDILGIIACGITAYLGWDASRDWR